MKNLFLLIILTILLSKIIHSQTVTYPDKKDSSIIQVKKIFKNFGKVFPSDFQPKSIILPLYSHGCQLNDHDIIEAEKILSINLPSQNKMRNNVRHFKNHWRQYLGYINLNGDTCLYIHLEKFKGYPSTVLYNYWKTQVSIVNEEWFNHYTDDFIIDLNAKMIKQYGK